ncbi:MAG: hypothetical protein A2275_12585 [Bacteroidetes bacterium RIFOXYA12_FULL_35_11]|nr:MAG: hypothetical protein A2X01_12395 [Bacteroidetes bacterium GWF2_35_48]OFY79227.1 MAG: hypothetical protein A2275_12585 [Bacteroidetes bacterium RIFOXYA12_FULL_35_11]OFY96414.1 MAG: hypothetical protein A2309_12355 [Bacteroidetes bacterium RIFOXYB2_FULL_35_7]HBX51101.1 hypothetical protein [Bacteroidales bacterium]
MEAIIRTDNKKLFMSLLKFLEALNISVETMDNQKEEESLKKVNLSSLDDFYTLSGNSLSKAYSENEPEYHLFQVKEPNPNYDRS